MNYRNTINYLIITVIFAVLWYMLEGKFLDSLHGYELLCILVGTHGGYGYYLTISTVFMLIHLYLVNNDIAPFSVSLLARKERSKALGVCLKNITIDSVLFALSYVSVPVLFVCIYVDSTILVDLKFYTIMFMYFIALNSIFLFGAMIYLMMHIMTKKTYLSMAVSVVLNIGIAYFSNSDILYGGLSVVDRMTQILPINAMEWGANQLINFLIIGIIYVVASDIYRKKDVL